MTKFKDSKLKKKLRVPLENRTTKMPIQLALNVPSTYNGKKLSKEEFETRIKKTRGELTRKFNGDTTVKARGDWKDDDGNVVEEEVAVVEVSMKRSDYDNTRPQISRYLMGKKKEWGQDSIGYKFEDNFYLYPKFKTKASEEKLA